MRSFSALNLSILAARDNKEPYLERAGFEELLDGALAYLAGEADLRGYVPGTGWHHSTAHTADLIKFLARSRYLEVADQGRILSAIAAKLRAADVYAFGEDERLAAAVLSLVRREDFDPARFDRWIDSFAAEAKAIWVESELDPKRHVAVQNGKNLMRALLVLVSGEEQAASEEAVRLKLLEALRG